MSVASHASPLARILFGLYVLLTVYASLYPLAGWHDHGLSPFAYLTAPWPRYAGGFDVAANVLGYVPYGFLCVAALYPRVRGTAAFLISLVTAFALSLLLEAAQSYLPARVAANLDVLSNVAGAAFGALAALSALPSLIEQGPLRRWRAGAFLPGAGIDLGLALVALWLFVQLNPATLLFGAGDLRDFVAPYEGKPHRPEFFVLIEAFTAAANLVSVSLLLSTLAAPGQPVRAMLVIVVAAALAIKAAASAVLMRGGGLAWLTHGAQLGLGIGLAIALAAVALPRNARLIIAAVLIMVATVLVNITPPNPYFAASLKLWQQGHFLNFNGLTRLVSAAWPFVALGYLMYLASPRIREPVS